MQEAFSAFLDVQVFNVFSNIKKKTTLESVHCTSFLKYLYINSHFTFLLPYHAMYLAYLRNKYMNQTRNRYDINKQHIESFW